MTLKVVLAVIACLFAGIAYYVVDLMGKRKQLDGLPQPKMKNLLLGHLHLADECSKLFPTGVHPHEWTAYIREKYTLPDVFYMDWRPAGPLWMIISNPEIANEYVLSKQCLPKSSYMTDFLDSFLGPSNLVSLEGQRWKSLRSLFNPGFSANNIISMASSIVDATLKFRAILEDHSKTNKLFELEDLATMLTIDIIGQATLDVNLDAQSKPHPIVRLFRERILMMPATDAVFFWQDLQPTRPFRLWWNQRQLDAAVGAELDAKIVRRAAALREDAMNKSKGMKAKRTVVDLALNAYEKEVSASGDEGEDDSVVAHIVEPGDLPAGLRSDIISSIKTFLFAGHDTTSSTISWCFYLLHRYPEVQKKVTAELDHFFPPGTSTAEKIKSEPYIINKLEYTTAVIKESLRIFPPISTIRMVRPEYPVAHKSIIHPQTGQRLPLTEAHIWPAPRFMHRNTRFFPKPTHFVPERFIPSQTPYPEAELFTPAGKVAFQAFHPGPRNCIGQELAMVETKIILALTVREFDFVLEFPGEDPDPQPPIPSSIAAGFDENTEHGKGIRNGTIKNNIIEGHRVWPTLKGTAKPNGGCPGRVKLRRDFV